MFYLLIMYNQINVRGSREVEEFIKRNFDVIEVEMYTNNLPIVSIVFKCKDEFIPYEVHFLLRNNLTFNHKYKIFGNWGDLLNFVCDYCIIDNLHEFNLKP